MPIHRYTYAMEAYDTIHKLVPIGGVPARAHLLTTGSSVQSQTRSSRCSLPPSIKRGSENSTIPLVSTILSLTLSCRWCTGPITRVCSAQLRERVTASHGQKVVCPSRAKERSIWNLVITLRPPWTIPTCRRIERGTGGSILIPSVFLETNARTSVRRWNRMRKPH
jgi:hypothetical protein